MTFNKKNQLLLYEWDDVREKVKKVLKRIGHDIPLVRHEADDNEITNIVQEESYVDINSK